LSDRYEGEGLGPYPSVPEHVNVPTHDACLPFEQLCSRQSGLLHALSEIPLPPDGTASNLGVLICVNDARLGLWEHWIITLPIGIFTNDLADLSCTALTPIKSI